MGELRPTLPVLLITAAFSRYDEALDWAQAKFEEAHGPVALSSPRFEFRETEYYEESMGPGLKKQFWAFRNLIEPERLAGLKLQTNQWEEDFAAQADLPEPRPLNIDPGYLTLAKLVLASTKDHAHRIYLEQGIFAEVTLFYRHHAWNAHPWTFPDYRREDYQEFFSECRDWYRQQQRKPSQ